MIAPLAQSAFSGKNADKTRLLTDWIAHLVERPLHALYATKKGSHFIKPEIGMCACPTGPAGGCPNMGAMWRPS